MEAISHEEAWKKHCIHTINLALERASPDKVSAVKCFIAHYLDSEFEEAIASMNGRDDDDE